MSQFLSATDSFPAPVIQDFAPVARELLACDSRIALLRGEGGLLVKQAIVDTIEEYAPRILSLDVFDTFLLRNDKAEAARYLELSQILRTQLEAIGIEGCERLSEFDLLLARVDALKLSYRIRPAVEGCREGTIGQALRIARRALGLAPDVEQLMLECELAYEAANVALNPVLLECAEQFRSRGGKVVLLSDMYLGRADIEGIVRRIDHDVPHLIHAIFSSGDHAVSKASGKMFALVEREFRLPPEAFLHIGDAWQGDVQRCREAGWFALHFPVSRAELARREESLVCLCADLERSGHDGRPWAKL
jgi:FMN phosphatase YigB (HAD superfamily)